ncbi:MAG: hypothetical protein KC620_14830 [Myxococcales bacterium]|nr:hypothetical protein [Myxococcales bacterium]
MSPFFPMPRGDLIYLAALIVGSVICFLPPWQEAEWGGMAVMGWLLAALMVLSPAIALVRILRERPGRRDGELR